MNVKKIKTVKNIDAFDSFEWIGDDLNKYNLVYGWNGSGKTTLSRLFSFLERKNVHIPDFDSVEFEIQTESGAIKQNRLSSNALNVRVFNEDFINDNLLFEESQAKKIVILGKENIETKKEIEKLEGDHKKNQINVETLEKNQAKLLDTDAMLTEAGGQVAQRFTNTPLGGSAYYGRSYNKSKIDKRLENGDVTEVNLASLVIPDQADIDAKIDLIKSEKKEIKLDINLISDFSELFNTANELLATTINVQSIEELKDDKDLRDWVEKGYQLHKERALTECQFCKNNLSDELLIRLGGFFTDELRKAKKQIDNTIAALGGDEYKDMTVDLEASFLFLEPAKECTEAKKELAKQAQKIKEAINLLNEALIDKRGNLHDHTKKHSKIDYPRTAVDQSNSCLKKIGDIVSEHNKKVSTISEEINKAAESIELHIIASVLTSKQYFHNQNLPSVFQLPFE